MEIYAHLHAIVGRPFFALFTELAIKATANGISDTRSCRLEDGGWQALNLDKPDCKRTCLALHLELAGHQQSGIERIEVTIALSCFSKNDKVSANYRQGCRTTYPRKHYRLPEDKA